MRSYYRQRAPEYDDWWNGTGLFERARPAGLARGRRRPVRGARGPARRRARSTSRAAPASSPRTCPARSPGWTRARRCSAVARDAAAGRAVRGGRRAGPAVRARHVRARPRRPLLRPPRRGAARGVPRVGEPARPRAGDHRLRAARPRARRGRSARSTTARATGSTSAGSPPRGWPRSSAAARSCTRAVVRVVRRPRRLSQAPEPAVRNERPGRALAERRSAPGSGSPPSSAAAITLGDRRAVLEAVAGAAADQPRALERRGAARR